MSLLREGAVSAADPDRVGGNQHSTGRQQAAPVRWESRKKGCAEHPGLVEQRTHDNAQQKEEWPLQSLCWWAPDFWYEHCRT